MISSAERAWFPVTSTVRMVRDPTPNSTRHSTSPASRAYRFRNRQRKKGSPRRLSPLFETPPPGPVPPAAGLMGGGLDHQGKPVLLDIRHNARFLWAQRFKSPPAGPRHPKGHQAQQPSQPSLHRLLPPYSSSSLSTQPVIRISPARMALISRSRPRIRRTQGPPFTWISSFP